MCSVKIYVGWCDEDKLRPSKLSSWSSKEHSCWLKAINSWELRTVGHTCSPHQGQSVPACKGNCCSKGSIWCTDDKAVAHSAFAKEKCAPIYLVHNGTHVFLASRWSIFFFVSISHSVWKLIKERCKRTFLFCLCSVPAVMQNSNTISVADGINPRGRKTDCVYFFSCMTLPPIYSKTQILQFSLKFRDFFMAVICLWCPQKQNTHTFFLFVLPML